MALFTMHGNGSILIRARAAGFLGIPVVLDKSHGPWVGNTLGVSIGSF